MQEAMTNNPPNENCCQPLHIMHTNYLEVDKIIASLKNNCSGNHDDIHERIKRQSKITILMLMKYT